VPGLDINRLWWVGGRFAVVAAHFDRFIDHFLCMVDLQNITKPEIIGRWWIAGNESRRGSSALGLLVQQLINSLSGIPVAIPMERTTQSPALPPVASGFASVVVTNPTHAVPPGSDPLRFSTVALLTASSCSLAHSVLCAFD
jgi:hypothetical protein